MLRLLPPAAALAPRFAALLLAASPCVSAIAAERWYTNEQVALGDRIYAQQCAFCHGDRGEGQPGWEQRDGMGFYPPPPLDETGHADEHTLADHLNTLRIGGGPLGGIMPSFSDVLDEDEMYAVIAWFQDLWPDEVYASWRALDSGLVKPNRDHEGHH
jgi:mono/diheme cytochrome c family protein